MCEHSLEAYLKRRSNGELFILLNTDIDQETREIIQQILKDRTFHVT